MARRFPPPWSVEPIAGGYVVKDASGQAIAYVYGRKSRAEADTALKCGDHDRARSAAQRAMTEAAKGSMDDLLARARRVLATT